ncbi:MAG: MBL fold metallo-hydrolase [Bacteroidetes bacterium]|nr:MBL fold metallo-hydrolase [Bacteroidota bacterium]MBU1486381.1 MBL fold metallo-hydrolase [Bacteroidota bacterium]MBU1761625.1 MBL fold metallo-hydrolase [Bacteroidota bacterium]MBU2268274.1 MBL fold metallo-hydrolase [Bacteroidota bacterium]MBU2376685.1 MBL fold metallo-hydrolase [Bacteroidota bacterium]
MLIYSGLAVALIAFFVLTFFNSLVFGAEPNVDDLKDAENFKDGVFYNQSETETMSPDGSFFKILKEWMNKSKDNIPKSIIPVVKTDLKNFKSDEPTIIWFGHSSYLLFIEGKKILVDPVFYRASPIPIFGKSFPMSYNYKPEDLPEIDILLISHDHYDHLDYKTIKELLPKVKHILTSAGVDAHFKLWGTKAAQITSLKWNDKVELEGFQFTALTARHFSGRKFKRANTLWSSFDLKTPNYHLYLGGDSGFDIHFEKIGKEFGPFDLAILECGQYGKYWPKIHMLPEEVFKAAIQLNTKVLFPIHWGKFALSTHPWKEPIERLFEKADGEDLPILTPKIGEPLYFTKNTTPEKWWRKV